MVIPKFIFIVLIFLLNAKSVAVTEKPIISGIEFARGNNTFVPLSDRELAFITSNSKIETDIITLMNEHLAQELAAGKKRITILTELRELLANQELSKTSIVIICLSCAILATSSFFALKWLLSSKTEETTTPPIASVANEDADEWEDIPLDSPAPSPKPQKPSSSNSFFDEVLDLDNAPKSNRRNHRTSIWARGTK